MKTRLNRVTVICCLLLLLPACISDGLTSEAPGTPEQPEDPLPTNTPDAPVPTNTPDPQILISAATLYSTDFENGYPPELYDWSLKWHVEMAADSNMIFCNEISDQWSSVLFGRDDWKNYALSLRMNFLSDNEEQNAETFIRITKDFEGYRANLSNNEGADISYYPPYFGLGSTPVSINQNEWFQIQLQFTGEDLAYFINGELVLDGSDDTRRSGRAGFGAGPNTEVCVDDILVWMIDRDGNPIESPADLVIEPYDGTVYTLNEKIENRATIPVFYPWSGNCGQVLWFDCDTDETPYGLVWVAAGSTSEIDSTEPTVSPAQSVFMRSDGDTLYLISEEWHYWNLDWQFLSPESIFYLDEIFGYHVDSEYGTNMMINFEHPEWPGVMAEKALNFKEAGFDGMMLDWWHNNAGNGRSREDVEFARMAIAKAIRRKVGDDFILLGNVNYGVNDPTAMYLSGVFLELWKSSSSDYSLASIERMEDLLIYWDTNLQSPKIIAFEPWKITTGDYYEDRFTEENVQYAKLFAAMAVVIPENGYILYADNNDDWDGGDHQHAYYDFYHTDFGKPISGMVPAMEGVAFKLFEHGLIAYNRTAFEKQVRLPGGRQFRIGPLEGLFLEGY